MFFSFTECCNNISWQNTLENLSNALDQLEYAHALKYGYKKELHTLFNNRRKFVKNEELPRLLDANLLHAALDQIL